MSALTKGGLLESMCNIMFLWYLTLPQPSDCKSASNGIGVPVDNWFGDGLRSLQMGAERY